ncbi:MAG: cell division protein FtsW (lipid II flippase) [Cellvibrionaceae bacterium]
MIIKNHKFSLADQLFIPAAIFMATNAIGLALTATPQPRWGVIVYFALWIVLWVTGQISLKRYRPGHDPYIYPIVMLLLGWGMLQVDRLAPGFAVRHAVWAMLGGITLLGTACWPGKLLWLGRYPYTIMLLGLGLVSMTFLFGTAPLGYGPRLWLKIPFVTIFFQPSELLKLLFAVFAAGFFSLRHREVAFEGHTHPRFEIMWLGPLAAMWLFSMSLLVLQQDLGGATLFFFAFMALIYMATGERLYVWGGICLLLIAALIANFQYDRVALRMEALVNPWPDASDRAFQIVQALYAIGAGGVIGSGIGEGFPSYIPVVHSDFALAAIAEEWGMIGSVGVMVCFAVLIWRGFMIALEAAHPFFRYLSAGITILLATQTIMIIGGVAKLLPLTGVTLPFVSYGGSSMVVSSLMVGLLLWMSPLKSQIGRKVAAQEHVYNQRLERLNLTFLTMFALMLIGLLWWGGVRADWLANREDNPRTVEAELRIQRGTIFDRNGRVLAENGGSVDRQERFLQEQSAASVVGYTSLRYGVSGIEEGLNTLLRGDSDRLAVQWPRIVMHRPQVGTDVRLTLDTTIQEQANDLLSGESGAVVLMSVRDGAIRAMASAPSFDPNQLDETFDDLVADENGPLLNRALQSNYQPGRTLIPFLLSWGASEGAFADENRLLDIDLSSPEILTLFDGWQSADVVAAWRAFGFDTVAESLPLPQAEPIDHSPENILQAVAGDEALLVTPLQVATALAALANGGTPVSPQIVSGVYLNDEWQAWRGSNSAVALATTPATLIENDEPLVQPVVARQVLDLFPNDGRVAGYAVAVESGPDQSNGWFIGFSPPENPRFVLVIIVEDIDSIDPLAEKGAEILRLALDS